jgi:hypothetical protein
MANVPLTDLTALPTTDIATGDTLFIVDVSEALDADKSKKITLGNLFAWQNYTPTVTYGGGATDPDSETVNYCKYLKVGNTLMYHVYITVTRGSGDRTYTQFTVPVAPAQNEIAGSAVTSVTAGGINFVEGCYLSSGKLTVLHGTMTADGKIAAFITYETT